MLGVRSRLHATSAGGSVAVALRPGLPACLLPTPVCRQPPSFNARLQAAKWMTSWHG